MTATAIQVVVDCLDPAALAPFWAAALGYEMEAPPPPHHTWPDFLRSVGVPEERFNDANAVIDPAGVGPRVFFQRVPEPKAGKNRLHLDVRASGPRGRLPLEERRPLVDAEAARLEGLGATRQREVMEGEDYFIVMQDPEGNEFCVV